MLYVEALEVRALLSATAIPGMVSLADPMPGQGARIGNNPLSSGPFLGWTSAGQTIGYLVDAAQTGQYAVLLQSATANNGVAIHLNVDGTNLTGTINLPNTQDFYNWQTSSPVAPIELTAGMHVVSIVIEKGTANFQLAEFSDVPFVGAAVASDGGAVGPLIPGVRTPVPPPPPPPATPPPPPASPPGVPTPPVSGKWKLTFDDEFNVGSLDSKWVAHQYWSNGPTIGEGVEESDPANVSVAGGALQLNARIDNSFNTGYTGALVQTGGIVGKLAQPTFSFKYGYAEASIKIPAGSGLWPAFWMLPAGHVDDNGEIDVMEMYDANTSTVFGTVHKNGGQQQHAHLAHADLSTGWHTFAVDWEPNQITWYLDGAAYATTTNVNLIPTVPMFPIFDLGVGGKNNPIDNSVFPATMQVDYVRIWQKG